MYQELRSLCSAALSFCVKKQQIFVVFTTFLLYFSHTDIVYYISYFALNE